MGLDKAKSLLTVTEGNSFLDLQLVLQSICLVCRRSLHVCSGFTWHLWRLRIAKQVANMKKSFKTVPCRELLCNSIHMSG